MVFSPPRTGSAVRLALAAMAFLTGLAMALAPQSHAAEPQYCEQDECEGRVICVDNPYGQTGCNMSGTVCYTYACD